MDGVINLIKPPGMTSHAAVAFIRRLIGQKRVGHGGTLDPGAAGVLPIYVGQATRLVQYTPGIKSYRAEMTLGISTSTQDSAGETCEVADIAVKPAQLGEAFARFLGEQMQVPPMFSAVRVGGRRLYELARENKVVARPPRRVHIYEMHIRKVWPEEAEVLGTGCRVLFDVRCSAGTYIRALCVDIGAALGIPAHMSFLVRTAAGPFTLDDAVTCEELLAARNAGRLAEYVLPADVAVRHLPSIAVDERTARQVLCGAQLTAAQPVDADLARVHDAAGKLIAIAKPVPGAPGSWQPECVLNQA